MTSDNERNVEHYYAEKPKSSVRYGLVHACLRGKTFEFLTGSSVFSVKRVDPGTRVLIENMVLPREGCVLDMGCGYGAVGIAAAKLNPSLRVTMTDVNHRAVLLSRKNIEKNHVHNANVYQGNLYEPVMHLRFNTVLSNPPVSAGMETVEAIIRGAPKVMAENGTLQIVIRSKIGKKTLPEAFRETYGNFEVLAIESGYRVLSAKKQSS
jgi:16S rRNA G1207 methylase RsmC